ncbi:Retrovirus-related Pol polyprotein from transposon TNT 1-94 [Gossypium australe]|uniref:Retrovirus-related Pol polyprotein from transposon TNT 1-94 n=1 Tax=Gossypium australe TaxID=47621 RepID=A0A5B6W5T1_9ROSI|nr:Retrovirus-related Pol polyprotein from transposon TNT 1-94 [Gossypium australe]
MEVGNFVVLTFVSNVLALNIVFLANVTKGTNVSTNMAGASFHDMYSLMRYDHHPPPPHNTHSMVTRSKDGIFKPKAYVATASTMEPLTFMNPCLSHHGKMLFLMNYRL